MKRVIVLALLAGGCASRAKPISPYVPPEAMYSAGGTMAAMGAVGGMAAGSAMMEKDRSPHTRAAGAGVTGAGAALAGAAILEAIEVEKERKKLINLYNAFLRSYFGMPAPEASFRSAGPPLPEVPFEFPVEDSPLNGKDPKP